MYNSMKAIQRETGLCDQASSKSSLVLGLRVLKGMMARMPLKHAFLSLCLLGFGQASVVLVFYPISLECATYFRNKIDDRLSFLL